MIMDSRGFRLAGSGDQHGKPIGAKIDERSPLGFNTSSSIPAASKHSLHSQHVNNRKPPSQPDCFYLSLINLLFWRLKETWEKYISWLDGVFVNFKR